MTNSDTLFLSYLDFIATLSWHSQKNRKSAIEQYRHFLESKNKTLLAATSKELIEFAKFKTEHPDKKKRIKRITAKTHLNYILYFYEFATFEESYNEKELKRIRRFVKKFKYDPGEEKTRLTKEQIDQLLEAVNCHITLKIATITMLNFGFRISELVNLRVTDIDFEKEEIIIHNAKGRKTREITMLDYQIPALKEILKLRKKMLPLHSKEDHFLINPKTGKSPPSIWLQKYYKAKSIELGFSVYAHRLRRTFASILFFEYDVDIYIIAWLLGHSSIETTMKYLGIKKKQKQKRYKKKMAGKKIVSFT